MAAHEKPMRQGATEGEKANRGGIGSTHEHHHGHLGEDEEQRTGREHGGGQLAPG